MIYTQGLELRAYQNQINEPEIICRLNNQLAQLKL